MALPPRQWARFPYSRVPPFRGRRTVRQAARSFARVRIRHMRAARRMLAQDDTWGGRPGERIGANRARICDPFPVNPVVEPVILKEARSSFAPCAGAWRRLKNLAARDGTATTAVGAIPILPCAAVPRAENRASGGQILRSRPDSAHACSAAHARSG